MTFEERAILRQKISDARQAIEQARDKSGMGERECGYCGASFQPRRWDQRFCTVAHRKGWWMRETETGRACKRAQGRRAYQRRKVA